MKIPGVHPDVIRLGLVSLLTDLSSEMIFAVFAVFFTTIAGASSALLGLIEGLADFSASSLDYASGWASDRTGRRKSIALLGYGFSTLAKIIPLVTVSVAALGVFRVVERMGKSLRGPPRDAWLASVAAHGNRGYSFGVHKALDKTGAIVGPLIAWALLSRLGASAATFHLLFWIAFVPAACSVLLLGLTRGVKGTVHPRQGILAAWAGLSEGFRRYLCVAGIFSLAYFSFGFLLLRAQHAGFSVGDIVLLYALFNACFVIAAPLTGRLGDRIGRTHVLRLGYFIYLLMCLGFAFATAKWQIVLLFAAYGIFYAIDEAQSKAYIADLEPERRATAIGVYNFITGVIYLPASLIAGLLWSVRPDAVFVLAACLSLLAIGALTWLRPAANATGSPRAGA